MARKDIKYPKFTWWQGIVEDRDDPAKLGRYRVRIFGHHTQSKERLPTAHLPWAVPMQPITSAGISGIGHSPTGLVEGSAVVGFFADGDNGQIPIIMGSLGVASYLPREDDTGPVIDIDRSLVGFFDPKGTHPHYRYPKRKVTNRKDPGPDTHASGRPRETPEYDEDGGEDVGENILEEADSSRLSRNHSERKWAEEHWSLKSKRETRIKDIPMAYASLASGGTTPKGFTHPDDGSGERLEIKDPKYRPRSWNEPHPQSTPPDPNADPEESKSEYPYNHVYESESGHIFEVDDTLGAERIHEMHKAGTFREIQPDGTKVEKVVGNNYVIDLKNKLIYVRGDYSMTVDGDYYLNIKGNKVEHISGHAFQTVRGSRISKIQGTEEIDTESTMHHHIRKNRNVQVGSQDPDLAYVGNDSLRVVGQANWRVKGKWKTIATQDRKDITFGNHKINVYPRYELDVDAFRDMLFDPTVKADPTALLKSVSKLELFAQQDVSIATGQLYPDPFLPFNPAPSVSIATARYNLSATADLYEKIGPTASFTGAASILLKPGYATRQASIAINNIQGVDTGVFSLIPGIQNFVTAGGMFNTILLGGMINTVQAGGQYNTVVAGGQFNTVIAGGIANNVAAGGILSNVTAGGITNNVTAGGMANNVTAGAYLANAVAGTATMTSGAGSVVASGAFVSVTAGGAVTVTAGGAASMFGTATTTLGIITSPTIVTGATVSIG